MNLGYTLRKPKKKRTRPARGMRRKIRFGFVVIGLLLLFSGTVSYLELSGLSRTTRRIMDESVRSLELAGSMVDAVNGQQSALYAKTHTPQADTLNADSLLEAGRLAFDRVYRGAAALRLHARYLNRIQMAKTVYDQVLRQPDADYSRADSAVWYDESYKVAYYDLVLAIRGFMVDSRKTVEDNTALVQDSAYRAIMPGVITLLIALMILIIFYILIDSYYIRPVLRVRQGLAHYIDARIPYTVQVEGHDEIRELNDRIGALVAMTRKKEGNE